MNVQFGFVAMSMMLEDASPSKTMTYKSYEKLTTDETRIYRLKKLTEENLAHTLRVMIHAHTHGVRRYRLTSKLVPLATHAHVIPWDYAEVLKEEFSQIGEFATTAGMILSAHPNHFTLLNSSTPHILQSAIRDLEYHHKIFEAMHIGPVGKLVLHIGGAYKDKDRAMAVFQENIEALPPPIKDRIILENDDKIYHAEDVLSLCKVLSVPMVFDVHHHLCNPSPNPSLPDLLEEIFNTWDSTLLPPKVHFSSPRSEKDIRSHADKIDVEAFSDFLTKAKIVDRDFDVMIEAKHKDVALFDLLAALQEKMPDAFAEQARMEF